MSLSTVKSTLLCNIKTKCCKNEVTMNTVPSIFLFNLFFFFQVSVTLFGFTNIQVLCPFPQYYVGGLTFLLGEVFWVS